jgi:hypothetical protein
MVRTLKDDWWLGFVPVAVFDFRLTEQGGVVEDIPYGGTVTDALILAHKSGIDTAIFAMLHVRREYVSTFVDKASDHFRTVMVVPNVGGVIATAARAKGKGQRSGTHNRATDQAKPAHALGSHSQTFAGYLRVCCGRGTHQPVLATNRHTDQARL